MHAYTLCKDGCTVPDFKTLNFEYKLQKFILFYLKGSLFETISACCKKSTIYTIIPYLDPFFKWLIVHELYKVEQTQNIKAGVIALGMWYKHLYQKKWKVMEKSWGSSKICYDFTFWSILAEKLRTYM